MMNKTFALVDGNNLYCSCELLFRPDLRKVPVAVLSNNEYSLFESPTETATSDRLMRTIDRINHGTGKIWFGGQRPNKDWFMKQELRSPAYTTRWEALPVTKAYNL